MSREIKFRAWDETHKKFIGSLILERGGTTSDLQFDEPYDQKILWLQCTGLKDKNGTDVYEGDRLRLYFNTDDVEDWLWLNLTEEEKKTGTREIIVEDLMEFARTHLPPEIEVIGNIYENKELLK